MLGTILWYSCTPNVCLWISAGFRIPLPWWNSKILYLHGLLWGLKIHSFTWYPLNAYSVSGTMQGTETRWKGQWPTHQNFHCSWSKQTITVQNRCNSRGNTGYFGEHIRWVFNSALGHQEILLTMTPELFSQVEGMLCTTSRALSACILCWEIWIWFWKALSWGDKNWSVRKISDYSLQRTGWEKQGWSLADFGSKPSRQ